MSAGNTGGTPNEGDDPFAYLYRPEDGPQGGTPQAPQPRPPSHHQVRAVGERTYGAQQGYPGQAAPSPRQAPHGYGQQPGPGYQQPDAYYAAPETQHGGSPYGPGPGRSGLPEPEPRRNGLLIGAIAAVTAVVLGVGAAILFSGDDSQGTAGAEQSQDAGGAQEQPGEGETSPEPQDGSEGGDEDGSEEKEPEELPSGDLTELTLDNGALLESTVGGARSPSSAYISGLNTPGALITWTFDFQGDPGSYKMNVGYSVLRGDQAMSFAVNNALREDQINLRDYAKNNDWATNWVTTFNYIELAKGQNTILIGCDEGDKCEAIIDRLWITERDE